MVVAVVRDIRLIPVYAGSTWEADFVGTCFEAHPRLRGEHPDQPVLGVGGAWLIPVYAGSTVSGFPSLTLFRAHPRLRGEHRSGVQPVV